MPKKLALILTLLTLSVLATAGWVYAQRKPTPRPPVEPPPQDNRVVRPEGSFNVDVLLHGQPAQEYWSRGRCYIEALAGEEYEVRVRNPFGVRVAVALSVDGLNSIDARRDTASNASKWVIEPYGEIVIKGWQVSDSRARRFYFTSERDSYAAKIGQTANFGVISAVFFRERRPIVVTPRPVPMEDREERGRAQDAPSSAGSARSAAKSAPAPSDEYPATGIGRDTRHNVTWTHMDLEPQPAGEVTIRYEFREGLIRLGIYPRPRPGPDPLQRRERSTGFDRGRYSPEP